MIKERNRFDRFAYSTTSTASGDRLHHHHHVTNNSILRRNVYGTAHLDSNRKEKKVVEFCMQYLNTSIWQTPKVPLTELSGNNSPRQYRLFKKRLYDVVLTSIQHRLGNSMFFVVFVFVGRISVAICTFYYGENVPMVSHYSNF